MTRLRQVALAAAREEEKQRFEARVATAKAAFEKAFGNLRAQYEPSKCWGLGDYVKIKSADGLTLAFCEYMYFRLGRRMFWWIQWSIPFRDAEGLGRQLRKFEPMCTDYGVGP